MIKLIASDVDGTLVVEGTATINPRYFDAISQLKDKGIQFVVASGRQYASILSIFEPVKNDIRFICDNGAYIMDQDEMIVCRHFDRDIWMSILDYVRNLPDVVYMLSCVEGTFTDSEDEEFIDWLTNGYGLVIDRMPDLEKADLHVTKVAVYCKKGSPKELVEKCGGLFEDKAAMVISGERWMDFMVPDTNKGAALRDLQHRLGITPDETMTFGDNYNDLQLMLAADHSYAVAGAMDAVKEAAQNVMEEGVEEDGVLHVLDAFLAKL